MYRVVERELKTGAMERAGPAIEGRRLPAKLVVVRGRLAGRRRAHLANIDPVAPKGGHAGHLREQVERHATARQLEILKRRIETCPLARILAVDRRDDLS